MNWKVGDRIIEKMYLCENPPRGPRGVIVEITGKSIKIKFDNVKGNTYKRTIDYKGLIPEELYDSPLYKLMSEND